MVYQAKRTQEWKASVLQQAVREQGTPLIRTSTDTTANTIIQKGQALPCTYRDENKPRNDTVRCQEIAEVVATIRNRSSEPNSTFSSSSVYILTSTHYTHGKAEVFKKRWSYVGRRHQSENLNHHNCKMASGLRGRVRAACESESKT